MSLFRRLRTSQIFRNLSWILSANVLVSAANFIGSVLVVRYLGISEYGHIVLALAVATMLTPLILQNSERLVMFAAADSAHPTGTIVGSMGGAMALAAIPCFVIVAAMPWVGLTSEPVLFFLVGLSLLPLPTRVLRPLMLYEGRADVNFWSDCIFAAGGLLIRVAMILGGAGLAWFGGAVLLQNLAAALVLLLLYRRTRPASDRLGFDIGFAWQTLNRSWPIILTSFATVIASQLDRVVLSQGGDAAAVGMLGLFVQMILPIRIIASSATAARLPRLISGGISDVRHFQAEAERGLALSISVSVVIGLMMLLALPLFSLLFAVDMVPNWPILAILIAGYVVSVPAQYRLEYAMAIGAERHYLLTTLVASVVGALVVVLLVIQYGLLGAAISSPVLSLLSNIIGIHVGSRMAPYRRIYWQSLLKGLTMKPLLGFVGSRGAAR